MTIQAAAVVTLLAWGALTFGGVYPWAYWPLFVACAAVGGAAVASARHAPPLERILTISTCCAGLAVALQVVPIPVGWLQHLSPGADAILRRYDLAYTSDRGFHAISLAPRLTVVALCAAAAVAVFVAGLARTVSRAEAVGIARGVAVLGVTLSFIGIAQKALGNGKIYGFWTPLETGGTAFGPFVNRNHFAGWVLMALPLTLGYVWGLISRAMGSTKSDVRSRLIWFSSPEANESMLLGFAIVVMSIAVMLSMSRSGMLGLIAGLTVIGWTILRRQITRPRRIILILYLVLIVGIAVGVVGFQQIADRFYAPDSVGMDGRLGIWADSWRVFKAFALVGTGVNTYGVATLFYQTAMPLKYVSEAHNDYLQLLTEGGVLVALPALGVMAGIVTVARSRLRELGPSRLDYWLRAGAVAGLLAIAIQEFVDFSLQIPANAALFATLLVLALRSIDRQQPVAQSRAIIHRRPASAE